MDQDQDDKTRVFWSHKELAQGMGLSRGHLYRLLEEGHMLGPDVVVAKDNLGWDPKRARRFGADADRLDADGNPRGPSGEVSLAKAATMVKTTYSKVPQVYLSSWLASYAYGLSKQAVYFMRGRRAFMPADVMVGRGQYCKYGWSEPRVIEFGEQTGRLDEAGIDRWVVRRTEEFGLSPDIAWVQKRLTENAGLTTRVERALEAWHASQQAAEES